jgi:hypothetical protein
VNERGHYGVRARLDSCGRGRYGGTVSIGQDTKSIGEQIQDISKLRNKFHMDWNLKILPKLRQKNEISAVFVRDLGIQLLQIRSAMSDLQTAIIKDPRHVVATAFDKELGDVVMEMITKYDQFLDKITPIAVAAGKLSRSKGESAVLPLTLDGPDSYDKLVQGALDESMNALLDLHRYEKAIADLWGPFGKSTTSAVLSMSKAIDRVTTEVKKVIQELPSPSELIKFVKWGAIGVLALGGIVVLSSVATNVKKGRDPIEHYAGLFRRRTT